jgi:hypothetical protein
VKFAWWYKSDIKFATYKKWFQSRMRNTLHRLRRNISIRSWSIMPVALSAIDWFNTSGMIIRLKSIPTSSWESSIVNKSLLIILESPLKLTYFLPSVDWESVLAQCSYFPKWYHPLPIESGQYAGTRVSLEVYDSTYIDLKCLSGASNKKLIVISSVFEWKNRQISAVFKK